MGGIAIVVAVVAVGAVLVVVAVIIGAREVVLVMVVVVGSEWVSTDDGVVVAIAVAIDVAGGVAVLKGMGGDEHVDEATEDDVAVVVAVVVVEGVNGVAGIASLSPSTSTVLPSSFSMLRLYLRGWPLLPSSSPPPPPPPPLPLPLPSRTREACFIVQATRSINNASWENISGNCSKSGEDANPQLNRLRI